MCCFCSRSGKRWKSSEFAAEVGSDGSLLSLSHMWEGIRVCCVCSRCGK